LKVLRREYPDAPIVGVGAIVIDQGKVLLVRRGQQPLQGEWSLPGGALELGETLELGVAREVLEETGLSVLPLKIVEVVDRITKDEASGRIRYHYVLVDFLCRLVAGSLCAASDATEACWAERNQLNSHSIFKLAPFTAMVIEKAFRMGLSG
jgi:8-oxo-dGTP diphosphatase